MSNKKQLEMKCFNATQDFINGKLGLKSRKYLRLLLPNEVQVVQSERPDFILADEKETYLLEHFMVDFCYDGQKNNQSESRRAGREINDIFTKFHDPTIGTIKDSDIDEAVSVIESEVNKITNITQKFDYEKYVQAFRRVFFEHYKRVSEYRKNPEVKDENIKVGFLIEFHCDTSLLNAIYNGSIVYLKGARKPFPMTADILNMFKDARDLDFIIISQFDEGVATEARYVTAFEPRNIKRSLELQRISVYDSVYYLDVTKNIKLNVAADHGLR